MDTNMENIENELDAITDEVTVLTPSQERVLLNEGDDLENDNQDSVMDVETVQNEGYHEANNEATMQPVPIDDVARKQQKRKLADISTDTSFANGTPNLTSSTVETNTTGKKHRHRKGGKRLSGAQVMKRRRLAMERTALKEQEEAGRTQDKTEDLGAGNSHSLISTVTDGAGNSDTGNLENQKAESSAPTDKQSELESNHTTSKTASKKKKKKKNNKKVQVVETERGETPSLANLSINTDGANQKAAGSGSFEEARNSSRDGYQEPVKGKGSSNTDLGISTADLNTPIHDVEMANRVEAKIPEQGNSNSNDVAPNLNDYWRLFSATKKDYVPASVMIDKLRKRPSTKAYTPAMQPNKQKNKIDKQETERADESLRLAIVSVDDQTGGLSETVLKTMEEHILTALDTHLDKMRESERPPILTWSMPAGKAYRVDCLDTRAADWLKATVSSQNFYPGQKLCVVLAKSLRQKKEKLLKVTTWVPGQLEDFKVLTKRIERLNPTLRASEWIKFKSEEKDSGQLISFGMPEAHLAPMEALECTAFCGTKMLHFRVKRETGDDNAQ